MHPLIDWYWNFGVKRGNDANDPDRELRKMSVGTWLDPAVQLLDRAESIRSNSGRACIALWGPSQTGKSTMLSRYIDGQSADGSDSALTWNSNTPVRFSPSKDLGVRLAQTNPNTLVFNPFNQQSDASGVATRYTLRDDDDPTVDHDFPVEIRLASRAQIVHALSRGYLSECNPEGETEDFRQDTFIEKLNSGAVGGMPNMEVYMYLKDIADVIEAMRNTARFNNLFRNNGWTRRVRPALVSSTVFQTLMDAEDFLTKTFWDGAGRLSDVYRRIEALRRTLEPQWGNSRIVATPEVAALLLDIDSFRCVVSPDSERGRRVQQKISNLRWNRDPSSGAVRISVGTSGGTELSGQAFGCFQALVGELVVPMKRSALVAPEKATFLELVEKADLLDLPGLSNINRGNQAGVQSDAKIDLSTVSDLDFFIRVFKEGKTQGFVHNYARSYGVDAFIVLARGDRYPSKTDLLNDGIYSWLRSFDPDWKAGKPTPMPLFLDLTFFATVINNIALNGVGNGLAPIVDRILNTLSFADKGSAKWFVTTYPQFPGGKIDEGIDANSIVSAMQGDPVFAKSTGMDADALHAVFFPDGGVEYLLHGISARLNPAHRLTKCKEVLERDWATLSEHISRHLPSQKEADAEDRKRILLECRDAILAEIDKTEQRPELGLAPYADIAALLKKLFAAPASDFAPVPFGAANTKRHDSYLKDQCRNWFEQRIASVEDHPLLDAVHQRTILTVLRDGMPIVKLNRYLREKLGDIGDRDTAEAARFPFSMAFSNALLCGECVRPGRSHLEETNPPLLDDFLKALDDADDSLRTMSPHYHSIILPVLDRLETLQSVPVAGTRPAQPGDAELKSLFDSIQTAANQN